MASEWKFEQVSEDFIDYSRDDYDYDSLNLPENFDKAPIISVSEYRARTSEVLPRGMFDEEDVPGILISRKDIPANSVNEDVLPPNTERFQEEASNYDNVDHMINEDKPISGGNTSSSSQNIIKENKKEQKKKKMKFKPFNRNSNSQSSNQPWIPNFSAKFKDDNEFPPL